jgi:hypothetical protein
MIRLHVTTKSTKLVSNSYFVHDHSAVQSVTTQHISAEDDVVLIGLHDGTVL